MMGSGGGTPPNQASALDGLLAFLGDPVEAKAKLEELRAATKASEEAAAALEETVADHAQRLADIDAGEARNKDEALRLANLQLELNKRAEELETQRATLASSMEQVQRDMALVEAKRVENEAWLEKAKADVKALQARASSDIQQSQQQAMETQRTQDAALAKRKAELDERETALVKREDNVFVKENAVEGLRQELQGKLDSLKSLLA